MSYPVHPTSPRGYVQTEKDETPPLCRQDSTIINLLAPTGPFKRVKSAWRRVKHPASTVMTSFCLFLICIIIGVFFSYQKDVYRVRSAIDASAAFTGGLYLQGQLEAIDTDNGLFTVAWSTGLGCEFDNATSLLFNPSGALLGAGIHCGQAMQNLNIYTQENASSLFLTTWTTGQWSPSSSDVYLDADSKNNASLSAAPQSWSTDMPFDLQQQLSENKYASTLAYPFDHYTAYITYLFSRTDTNATVPVFIGYVQSSIPNWSVSSDGFQLSNCTAITLDSDFNVVCTSTGPDSLQRYIMQITARRSTTTIAFVSLIWLTNWIITLVILWVSLKVVVFGGNLSPDLILVPITALFSLPAVRGVMPSAPDFGSYMDVMGFLFNLTIISLCAAGVLVVGIRRNFAHGYKED